MKIAIRRIVGTGMLALPEFRASYEFNYLYNHHFFQWVERVAAKGTPGKEPTVPG